MESAWMTSLLPKIACTPAEHRDFTEALADIKHRESLRKILVELLIRAQVERSPRIRELHQTMKQQGNISPFSMVLLKDFCILAAYVGKEAYPPKPLIQASNQVMRDMIVFHREHPFIKMFVKISDGDWQILAQNFPAWRKLYSNYGRGWVERPAPNVLKVFYDNSMARIHAYVSVGVMQGIMDLFEVQGKAEATHVDEDLLEITLKW